MINRVIVCGGRDFKDEELCYASLDKLLNNIGNIEIVSGNASGADTFGEKYAEKNGFEVKIFKPDWKKYGRAAGPIRNREMLEYALAENAIVVAFWDGKSKGTKNMISQAQNS